jgi:steroid delta-isomerase-like uncharacterized protein
MTTSAQPAVLTSNELALAQAIARWNDQDLDGYLHLYDDAIQLHGYTPEAMDKAAVREFYASIFTAFPGCTLTIHEVVTQGDALACRFTLAGRHDGPFMGVPATGRDITLPGITILHFRDGLVTQRWSAADMLGVLVQIGAVPPPS